LFGSFAYGTPHEYSDVDLLVIMPAREELTQAARIQLAFEPVLPLDILVRTPQRLRRRLAEGDAFLREVMTLGTVLYEKRNPRLGPQRSSTTADPPFWGGAPLGRFSAPLLSLLDLQVQGVRPLPGRAG
jgi:predicted nucleotidyltransferase